MWFFWKLMQEIVRSVKLGSIYLKATEILAYVW